MLEAADAWLEKDGSQPPFDVGIVAHGSCQIHVLTGSEFQAPLISIGTTASFLLI